jgi:ABC-type dipeptide/oligopeptide/nickel transport system permease subunit
MGIIGLAIIFAFIVIAIAAPYVAPYNPFRVDPSAMYAPPSWQHLLGTNDAGEDLLSELMYAAKISLIVGFAAAFVSTCVGMLVGLFSGYYGGKMDTILMRITDIFLTLPSIVLLIVLVAYIGPGLQNIIFAISILGWTGTARSIRSQVMTVKERSYVEASRATGASNFAIMFKEILPNIMPLVLANGILAIVGSILSEAGLSFLGLGDPTQKSWGEMLYYAEARGAFIEGAWWWIVPPGLCIALVAVGFTLVGQSLDELFNPRVRLRL